MNVKEAVAGLLDVLGLTREPTVIEDRYHIGAAHLVCGAGMVVKDLPGPMLFARRHQCETLDGLVAWMQKLDGEGRAKAPEVLVGNKKVVADLRPGADDTDVLIHPMTFHPLWFAFCAAVQNALTPLAMMEWVRTMGTAFGPVLDPSGKPTVAMSNYLIGELRKLAVLKASECKANVDPSGFMSFTGTTAKFSVEGVFPPTLELELPVYANRDREEDLDYHAVEVLLALTVDETNENARPVFTLRCPTRQSIERTARVAVAETLRTMLGGSGATVALGEYAVEQVRPIMQPPV